MANIGNDAVLLEEEQPKTKEELVIRPPRAEDGSGIWSVARRSGKLDVNSPYCYMLLGSYFAATCAVAVREGMIAGFVSGFRLPERPDTWFVWQIAVDAGLRGEGVGRRLLEAVLHRPENRDVRYIEATVSPSNEASQALFRGLAKKLGAACGVRDGFRSEMFPEGDHEEEPLLCIGPIQTNSREDDHRCAQ